MNARTAAFLRGVRAAVPFVIVMGPFGMLFGVASADAGLNLFEISAFSLTVFAGAAQFAALQLMQDQAPLIVILATSLAVNLRLLMYSVALAPEFGGASVGVRAALAYFLVDQVFVVTQAELARRPGQSLAEKTAFYFGAVLPVAGLWFGASFFGAVAGQAIPPEYALDFAVPITFLAMIAPMLRSVPHLAAALVSVAGTLALSFLPYGTGLLVAAVAAMAAGVVVELISERRAEGLG
jgi:predicted branched-subunit amino acid permease